MPFIIPDFTDTKCLGIAACGDLETEDQSVLSFMREHDGRTYVGVYRDASGIEAFLRLGLGGDDIHHVHLDAYRRELFPGESRGESIPIEQLIEYLGRLQGHEILGRSYGRFVLPVRELSKGGIVQAVLFDRSEGGIAIRATDGSFEIKGAPVRSIAWSLIDDGRKIMIDVEAPLVRAIDGDYLMSQLSLIDASFRVFVMGEPLNEPQ